MRKSQGNEAIKSVSVLNLICADTQRTKKRYYKKANWNNFAASAIEANVFIEGYFIYDLICEAILLCPFVFVIRRFQNCRFHCIRDNLFYNQYKKCLVQLKWWFIITSCFISEAQNTILRREEKSWKCGISFSVTTSKPN